MKEQIEAMAKVTIEHCEIDNQCGSCEHATCNECLAEVLYDAGYRKQSDGEWIWINQAKGYLEPPYGDTCKCSLCGFVIDVSESNYNFCPDCGAHMKGGAE